MSALSYASLAQLRSEVKAGGTGDDAVLLDYGRSASAAIDAYVTGKWRDTTFAPRRVTRYYDARFSASDLFGLGRRLELGTYAVAVSSVVDAAGTTLVEDTDFYALPRGRTPFTALYRYDGTEWCAYSGDTPVAQIAVTCDMCYRENYDEAWVGATTLSGDLNDSAATVNVTSAAALSPGMLIRVDSEWMVVDSITVNALTVTRAARGSSAAAHTGTTPVYRFVPDDLITRATARWAALAYARRGAFEQTTYDGVTTVQYPDSMPAQVRDMLHAGGWAYVRLFTA